MSKGICLKLSTNYILKVVVWRAISITITTALILAMTGSASIATSMSLSIHAVLIVAHYIFECTWEKLL